MRTISPEFHAHLDSGTTTICTCWLIERSTGDALGFTDHDEDIVFEGNTFEATSGFAASAVEQTLGLGIDNGSATGALISDRLTEADIASGRFDGARIMQWQVNWSDPAQRVLIFRGELGEIRRGEAAFEVELRGLSEVLNRPAGRSFLPVCDAALGDGACRFDTSQPGFSGAGVVAAVLDSRRFAASGLAAFAPGWFTRGSLNWVDGPQAGETMTVISHRIAGELVELVVDRDLDGALEVGAALSVVAGCDKRKDTCASKFDNLVNFRGFPFMPGEHWLAAYPVDGEAYGGGSMNV